MRAAAAAGLAIALIATASSACGPREDDPCGVASVCGPDERCFAEGCDAAARCAHGLEAAYYGRATPKDGTCVATDDAACRASSLACATWGQCSAPPAGFAATGACPDLRGQDADFTASRVPGCAGRGTCVATDDDDCRASRGCGLAGRCHARDGVCVALSDVDCRPTTLCAEAGYCARDASGGCRAGSDQDCQRSTACRERAQCGVRRGDCVDCGRSEACRTAGLCAFRDGRCVRCDQLEACRDEGACVYAGGACRAMQPAHCQSSRVCRDDGRCRVASDGTCTK